jgi:anthranilate 1,2-dioxygenase small subunit
MTDTSTVKAASVYERIIALEYRYARVLDEDRLEIWPELFTEDGVYKVVPRENINLEVQLPIMFCDSRNMIKDRVRSLREANIYNLHYSRHLITNVELIGDRDGMLEVAACFVVYQTDMEGQTRCYSVGQYLDRIVTGQDGFMFQEKVAICDTFSIPNLLAVPL